MITTIALATLLTMVGGLCGALLMRVFQAGQAAGKYRQDIQDLHRALSVHGRRYDQLNNDFYKFRLKIAARLGINGSD
jgi:hypothetical protein